MYTLLMSIKEVDIIWKYYLNLLKSLKKNTVLRDLWIPILFYLIGKIVEAEYDKMSDSYIINAWYYDPKFIKGVVNWYNIKDLSDGKEYTLSF